MTADFTEQSDRRSRLQSAADESVEPWAEATQISDVCVFWLPVSVFPLRNLERAWLQSFLQRLSDSLKETFGLREEIFLRFAVASGALAEPFNRYSMRVQILPGMSRRPGEALQGKPDLEQVKEEIKETNAFDLNKWTSDYAVWFQNKRGEEQREMFFGWGGMSILFLPPDPKTTPPTLPYTPRFRAAMPVFQQIDVDSLVEGTMALNDGFLQKSKDIFGTGLGEQIDVKTIGFVLPSLESRHFVGATPEIRATWFELFDVYCRESMEDGGVLLAMQPKHRPIMVAILQAMKEEGMEYPLRISRGEQ